MQIWKKLGLTVVFCVLSAGMTVNAGFTGSNVHSAGQSMGVGGLLEESMDPEACLEAAQNAKETRKKIYGYENLGVAKVNDYLNIRKDPSENGELVGKLPKNGGADVLSEENGWYKIKSGKVTGYVRADYMVTGEEARNLADKEATNMAVCNSGGLRVREEGSLDAPVITLVAEGEELEVVDIQDDWVKIMLDDEAAYVSADYVDIAKKLEKAVSLTELKYGQGVSDIRVDLVNYAKQFLGNPYVWGGTSLTKGADCSGFVLSIMKKYGVSLPHHSAARRSAFRKHSRAIWYFMRKMAKSTTSQSISAADRLSTPATPERALKFQTYPIGHLTPSDGCCRKKGLFCGSVIQSQSE